MKRKILSLVLLSFIILKAYPQNFVSQIIRGERGISKQLVSLSDNQPVAFNGQVKELFGLNSNVDLILKKIEHDKLGFVHYRYYQTYRNIPIENAMYMVHARNGLIKSLGGSIVTDFDERMNERFVQKISAAQAVDIAVKYVGAKQYAWQDAGMERSLKEQTKNNKSSYLPKAGLVWYSPGKGINPRELRLCYKVDVYARQPLSRAFYFVDASTGQVLGKKDELFHSDAVGTANTAYSGTQTIHSDFNGTNYRLRDNTKGDGVITLHGEAAKMGNNYTSTSANWTLTGTNIAALDAHYGVSQTYAFYWASFARNSYDDAGGALISYVNEDGVDNAYWDGSTMHFFKLSDGTPGGVTGIDVTGHELTHGVTQESSGLEYSYESGAMNESISDIMGKSVQFWSKPTDIDWRLSNDIGWIIRDMSNPNAEGQPDTYLGDLWFTGSDDNGGVHYNSGVGNFMFYLLVTGGSGTNDNGAAYSVTGIGLGKADQIINRTNTVYLTPTSQYFDWRAASISAATDLYGAASNEVAQVQNAFHAVGIGSAAGVCDVPTGITSSNVTPTSATISWDYLGGGEKYKLQYRLSTTSTWTTKNNINSDHYNLTGLTSSSIYKYRLQTICGVGSTSSYSAVGTFITPISGGPTYCTSSGSTGFEYINKVVIGSINKVSGNNGGYGNYTGLSTTLTAGVAANIKLSPGFTGSDVYDEYWTVFIDYNHNGILTDAGEKVTQGHGSGAVNRNITVPATALNGLARMRVVMHFDAFRSNPCGTFAYGEVEDYTVNITGGTIAPVASNEGIKADGLNNLVITPNPLKGSTANLIVQASKSAPVNIKIADLSGRVLRSETISGIQAGKNNHALNNLNLQPGTYMIVAQQGGTIIGRAQLVVAK